MVGTSSEHVAEVGLLRLMATTGQEGQMRNYRETNIGQSDGITIDA